MSFCRAEVTSRRKANSTTSRLVLAPDSFIASATSRSSITILVRFGRREDAFDQLLMERVAAAFDIDVPEQRHAE